MHCTASKHADDSAYKSLRHTKRRVRHTQLVYDQLPGGKVSWPPPYAPPTNEHTWCVTHPAHPTPGASTNAPSSLLTWPGDASTHAGTYRIPTRAQTWLSHVKGGARRFLVSPTRFPLGNGRHSATTYRLSHVRRNSGLAINYRITVPIINLDSHNRLIAD